MIPFEESEVVLASEGERAQSGYALDPDLGMWGRQVGIDETLPCSF